MAKQPRSTMGATPSYQLVQVPDLTGGVDLRRALSQLGPTRARRLVNWDLSNPGELRTYPGYLIFSTSSLGARRVQGASRIYIKRGGDATFLLAADNGSAYKPSDAGVWGSAVLTGLHATNLVQFVHDRDLVTALDGSTAPKKSIDGTNWTNMGISPPGSAATASAVSGGSLVASSTYEFSYSYQDDGYVYSGNEGATVQQAVSGSNLTVRLTIPRSTDAQVDTIIVYARNVTTGESVRRRVGTVANPGSGSATYDVSSENWNNSTEAPTDHDAWTACKMGCVWKNRWWGVDATVGNRLKFSQIFLPQALPALFYIDLPFEQGDDIRGMAPLGDVLVVWGSRRAYLVIGQTSLDFEVRPAIGALSGILGPNAWCQVESGLIHAAADGVYLFDGSNDRLLSHDIEVAWQDYVKNASADTLYRTPITYHLMRKEVRIGVTRLYPTTSAGEWILNLARTAQSGKEAWGATTRTIGGYIHWNGPESVTGAQGRMLSWNLTTAELYEEAIGLTGNGGNRTFTYEGPGLTTGIHAARFVDTFGEYEAASGTFVMTVVVDGEPTSTITVDTSLSAAEYDLAEYDLDVYALRSRKMWTEMLPISAEGRNVQVTFTFTGKDDLIIYNYSLGLVPEPFPRGF